MAYHGYSGGPYHTNPAFNGTQEKFRPAEVAIPVTNMSVTRTAPKWSWCSSGWSIFTTFCCCSWCGFLGLLFSVWSYVDHKSGDYERASFKRRWAWGCSIFGLLLGLLILVAFLVVIFVFKEEVCEEWGTANDLEFCTWKF